MRLDTKYDWTNTAIQDKHLVLRQRAYSPEDLKAYRPVSIAGIQSRAVDLLHGTYRTTFKLEGSKGGACAGFFWYRVCLLAVFSIEETLTVTQDDTTEIDIEIVTPGTSLVNNTINYTLHPSLSPDESPISNASLSVALDRSDLRPESFHEYRFDCHPDLGVDFYVDGKFQHHSDHHIPTEGGNLQVKLWADGNKWWSGVPSTTDVFMTIKSIVAYYNTTELDVAWVKTCKDAGGPSKKTICTIK